jgi:hypothetical protein
LKRYDELNAFHSETLDGGAAKGCQLIIAEIDPRKQQHVSS